jgi:hypothetical protein
MMEATEVGLPIAFKQGSVEPHFWAHWSMRPENVDLKTTLIHRGLYMKRIFALGAVALLMSTAGAAAGTKTISLVIEGLTCELNVTNSDAPSYGITYPVIIAVENKGTSCGTTIGEGLVGRSTIAKGVTDEAAIVGASNSFFGAITITLKYPLETGGQFTFSNTTDGKTINYAATGTYTLLN